MTIGPEPIIKRDLRLASFGIELKFFKCTNQKNKKKGVTISNTI